MSSVTIQNVTKSFGNTVVLENFDAVFQNGEFITLLGPSGCGKSTTLRIIGGFEKPDKGRVLFDGKDITNLTPDKRNVNTVFQKYALFPHLNVYNNIAFGLKLKKLPSATIEKKVKQALKMVGLTDYEDRDVDSLSGGQQQRVAIARAVVGKPMLILADEPTGNLDSKNSLEIMKLLSQLNAEGTTIVMVTHSQHDATYADRIINLFDGQIVDELEGKL